MNAFSETIKRFFLKSFSDKDLKDLFLWFNSVKGHSEINDELDKKWDSFEFDDNIYINSEKLISNIRKEIKKRESNIFRKNIIRLIPYAAIFILVISTVFFLISYNRNKTDVTIQPKIQIQYASVITENGQRSKIILPDSSLAWLNAGTNISYCYDYSQNKRKVILDGQAFFQVTRDEGNPFIVETKGLIIEVLGTSFDVNSYKESGNIYVMLESGKVELAHQKFKSFSYTMKPGELATFDLTDSSMNISYADAVKYSAWKDGKLIFRNTPMRDVISKLRRWYNIDIIINDDEVYNSIFTGTIQSESYEQIFRLIEFSCPIKCKMIHHSDSEEIPEIILTKNN